MADELVPEIKNPLGLNQAEIVASLAIELVKSVKRVINPITKESFRVKFGRKRKHPSHLLLIFFSFVYNRFSFWTSCWWNSWCEELSVLSIW